MSKTAPIFIPSKGRANNLKTAKLLDESNLPYTLVVEPQEQSKYADVYGKDRLLVLPENNRGIAYSRQFILDYNKSWFWMIDDDISYFAEYKNKKTLRCTAADALKNSQAALVALDKVMIGALSYIHVAWKETKPINFASGCLVCVLMNGKLSPFVSYDQRLNMKEDIDMSLQVLSAGFMTAKVTKYAFSVPGLGTNKGGLYETYADKENINSDIRIMTSKYPGLVNATTKLNGMRDLRVSWKKFL